MRYGSFYERRRAAAARCRGRSRTGRGTQFPRRTRVVTANSGGVSARTARLTAERTYEYFSTSRRNGDFICGDDRSSDRKSASLRAELSVQEQQTESVEPKPCRK